MKHDDECCIFDRQVRFCCCIDYELEPDQIDDLIDLWHSSGIKVSLASYLGMTWDDYKRWVAS